MSPDKRSGDEVCVEKRLESVEEESAAEQPTAVFKDVVEKADDASKVVEPGQQEYSTKVTADTRWARMVDRLVLFREKYGHCLVPNRYPEDTQLGSWVSTQRRQYKFLKADSEHPTPMTQKRVDCLEALGFQWSIQDPRYMPWETRYAELVEFTKKYGHSQVPIGFEENVQLSNWVSTQRQEYKMLQKGRSSRLSEDRIRLLNKVDFVWEAQRGGKKRKKRATVSVPPQAKPAKKTTSPGLEGLTPLAKQSSPFGNQGGGMLVGQGTTLMAQFPGNSGAISQMPCQGMAHGSFQQKQSMVLNSNPCFPTANPWPTAPMGFQFVLVPNSVSQSVSYVAAPVAGRVSATEAAANTVQTSLSLQAASATPMSTTNAVASPSQVAFSPATTSTLLTSMPNDYVGTEPVGTLNGADNAVRISRSNVATRMHTGMWNGVTSGMHTDMWNGVTNGDQTGMWNVATNGEQMGMSIAVASLGQIGLPSAGVNGAQIGFPSAAAASWTQIGFPSATVNTTLINRDVRMHPMLADDTGNLIIASDDSDGDLMKRTSTDDLEFCAEDLIAFGSSRDASPDSSDTEG